MKKIKLTLVIIAFLFLSLNTSTFASESGANIPSDLENHWSKESVIELIEKNVISGYPDGTFKPDAEITVAEFIKILMINNQIPLGDKGLNWYDQYINPARDLGLIQGGEITDYNVSITRGEMARIISRSLNLKLEKYHLYHDFEDGLIFRNLDDYVENVKTNNIMGGYENGKFEPFKTASRGEASKVLSNVNKYLGDSVVMPNVENIPQYNADGSWTDEWFLANASNMDRNSNYSDYLGTSNFCFKDGKLVINSNFFEELTIQTVEDPIQNERLFKLIKYYMQRAYETNRYARVEYWQATSRGDATIRVDFSPTYMGMHLGYLVLDFPLYPETYISDRYKSNIGAWNNQRVDVIWEIGAMGDKSGFPSYIDYMNGVERNKYLEKHGNIFEPYREVAEESAKMLYGDSWKEILAYMLNERDKNFKIVDYVNYSQLEINNIKLHNSNGEFGEVEFLTEIK
ncbi:MAG: S-layer homology domain-containing protein [Acidaminobacteraceae bacterium]